MNLAAMNKIYETSAAANDFAHFCGLLLRGQDLPSAAAMAEANPRTPPRVREILKAAVDAGTTTGTTWAAPLAPYTAISEGFIASLRSRSVFDAVVAAGMRRAPLRTKLAIVTAGADAQGVDEDAPKPLSRLSMDGTDGIAEIKIPVILILPKELLRLATPGFTDFLSNEMRTAIAKASDAAFLPAAIDGLTPLNSVGETAVNFLSDLRTLVEETDAHAAASCVLAVTPLIARQVALMSTTAGEPAFPQMTTSGGTIAGIELVPSDAQAAETMTLIDATGFIGDPGQVFADQAAAATLEFSDGPGSGAQQQVSLFQTGSKAIRLERRFGFERTRDAAVATMSGADYSNQVSG